MHATQGLVVPSVIFKNYTSNRIFCPTIPVMNENQPNNTKEIRPRKPRGRPEGSKRKRVKPSIGPYEEPTPRVDPILRVAYDLLNQLKSLMENMFDRQNSRGYIDEQVFTTSLAIIGWLNQQVTLRYALEVQNYRGVRQTIYLDDNCDMRD